MSGMQNYAALLAAAGLLNRDADDFDIYELAGRVIHDDLVVKRALKFRRGSVLPSGARLQALQEMTKEELVALRERVCNIVPFVRKESGNKNSAEQIARETAKNEALEPEEDES